MPIISFGERDLLRGKIVTPAWYRIKIGSVGEAPVVTPKGPSTNYPVEATIQFNGDTGDQQFAGVPLDWVFNSKALSFAIPFLAALGQEVKAGQRIDLAAAKDMEIDVFVGNKEYQGRMLNNVDHQYRKPIADVKPV